MSGTSEAQSGTVGVCRRATARVYATLLLAALIAGIWQPAFVSAQNATTADSSATLFGPRKYVRSNASKNDYRDSFVVSGAIQPPYVLRIVNGDASGNFRISSAQIELNGTEILDKDDLNQRVASREIQVRLRTSNTLRVVLASGSSGSYLTISITGVGGQQATSTAVASSLNPSTAGQSVTFTASVSGGATPASGTATFFDGATALGTGTLSPSGVTTLATSALAVGTHAITARYDGDVTHSVSTSSPISQVINASGSVTRLASNLNPSVVGQSVTFSATVTGGTLPLTGTVTFLDGATPLGAGTLNGAGIATFVTSALSQGSHVVTAQYGGDTNTAGSTSLPLTQVVNAAPPASTTTAIASSVNPSTAGESVTFTATVAGGTTTPTGTVTFADGATTLGTGTLNGAGIATFATGALTVGSHTISASYSSDATHAASASSLVQLVGRASSTTTLISSANPSTVGQSVTFTATVTGGTLPLTGTVTFLDGATPLGTGTLNGAGLATFVTSALSQGSHVVTAQYGGDTNTAGSTSSPLTQVVNAAPPASTSTAIASSVNPSTAGQSVTFTATVTGGVTTPTGTVTFADGATALGTGALNASGIATLATSALTVGSRTISASYGSDATHAASASSLVQLVGRGSSTTTLISSANPSTVGQSVTFTATVTGGTLPLTGTVTFLDGATPLGAGTLNGAGLATFATSALSQGSHVVTAQYGGDSNTAGSTSSPLTQVVNAAPPAATTTAIASSVNPSTAGQSVTFTATVTGGTTTPAGTVTFADGATTLGTGALNASGIATFATSALTVGSHTITASYSGDATHAASASSVVQLVGRASSTTTLISNANPSTVGQSVTFSVTVTGGTLPLTGTVTFLDGATPLGTGTLNGAGLATFVTSALSQGSHVLTAQYGGDTNTAGSTSSPLTQVVNAAPPASTSTAIASSVNPSTAGQSVTFTATVTGGTTMPTGTVTFADGATTLGTGALNASGIATFATSALTVGSHTITASYSSDATHAASASSVVQLVGRASSTTTLISSANPSTVGQSVTFSATVTGGTLPLTGTVTFLDGATTLGTGTLNGAGLATFVTSALSQGSHVVTAQYGGDASTAGSTSSTLTQVVNAAPPASTTTAIASSVNPSTTGESVTFTATVTGGASTPTGTVTFTDGATTLGTGTLNGTGIATFATSALTVGSHTISASYSSDATHAASASSLVQLVGRAFSTTTLISSANPSTVGQSVTFSATVAGGTLPLTGTVSFLDGATPLGAGTLNSAGLATFVTSALSQGSHVVTAQYGGDTNTAGSPSSPLTQVVNAAVRPPVAVITGGPFTATLGVPVSLDGSSSSDPAGRPLTYSWILGDGAIATGPSLSHAYLTADVFTVRLTVTNDRGDSAATTTTVAVAQPHRAPVGSAGGPYSGEVGLPLAFAGSGSSPDGDALSFAWDFGDGTQATGATPVHAYATQGTFTVTLTITDAQAATAIATATATIGPRADRTPPVVKVNAPLTALPGARLTVTADANDNVGVTSVGFDVSGAASSVASASPFERVVDIPSLAAPNSLITVRANARDAANNNASDQVSIKVVAAPDTVAPSVVIQLPPSAAPGTQVRISALASDDVGVRSVAFATAGVTFATVSTPPYTTTYLVPRDTAPNSVLSVTARAVDFSNNAAESSRDLPIVAAPDTTPPSVTLQAPESVKTKGVLHLTATASDDVAVAGVDFVVDEVTVGRALPPAFAADVPVTAAAGSVLRIVAVATDSSGNVANSNALTRVLDVPTGRPAVIAGRVYDDSTGLPLANAIIALSGTDAGGRPYDERTISTLRGEYSLAVTGGEGVLQVTAPDYSRVDRAVTIADLSATVAFDARLTPLGAVQPVSFVPGRTLTDVRAVAPSTTPVDAALTLSPGALADDSSLRLTVIGPQGLQGLLPLGWSPVGAVDIAPHGTAFNGPQLLSIANRLNLPTGTTLVLAGWDESAVAWRAVTTQVVTDAVRLTGLVPSGGQWAWLMADTLPLAPPVAVDGALLEGVAASGVPDPSSVVITPQPQVLFYKPGVNSIVGGTLNAVLPSGTPLRGRIAESYTFSDGSEQRPDSFLQDLVVFQKPGPASTLSAGIVVTPSLVFDADAFRQGVITVQLAVPSGTRLLPAVDGSGGNVSGADGAALLVPPGAFSTLVPVSVELVAPDALGYALPAGLTLVGAVNVGFSGATPVLPSVISIARPDSVDGSSPIVLLKVVQVGGATQLQMVGSGHAIGTRIVSANSVDGTAAQLEGVSGPGRYLFARGTSGLAFVAGTVFGVNSSPLAGALVDVSGLGVVGLTDAAGRFVLASLVGSTIVGAEDLGTLDSGAAPVVVPGAGVIVSADIHLASFVFAVTDIAPPDGAVAVARSTAVVATFSAAVDAASVTAAGVSALGLTDQAGAPVSGALTLSNGNTHLVFRPTALLAPNSTYSATVSPALRDTRGRLIAPSARVRFATISTSAPIAPPAGNMTATVPAGGVSIITATQGTADPRNAVSIVNTTTNSSCPALVQGDGSFTASCAAGLADRLQVVIADTSGNQTVVPLPAFTRTNADGSTATVIGSEGGRALGPAGLAVDVPASAVPDGTVVTIQSVDEPSFPVVLSPLQKQTFTYAAGLRLDFGGVTPAHYVNVSFPASGGEPTGRNWVVAEASQFAGAPALNVVDTARVIAGRITTSSPPCPGVVSSASSYAFLQTNGAAGTGYGRFVEPGLGATVTVNNGPAPLYSTGPAPTPDSCFPILTGKVSVMPNTQKVVLAASTFTPRDREIVVYNSTIGATFHYPRNVAQYRFLVAGRVTDSFTVNARSSSQMDVAVTDFEMSAATPGFVNIVLDISKLNISITEIFIQNETALPGVPAQTTFPQNTAAVELPVPGGSADIFEVRVVDEEEQSRVVAPASIVSPVGAGNLVARAVLGSIDQGRPVQVFLDKLEAAAPVGANPIATLTIPPEQIVDGGFRFTFDGTFQTEAYRVRAEYPATTINLQGTELSLDARADQFIVPRVVITVSDVATGRVIDTVNMPVPPPDDPFYPLGNISGDHTPPSLTISPVALTAFDTVDLLTFTFSEGIDRESALNGMRVLDEAGGNVAGEVRLSNGNKTVTFVPRAPLQLGASYSVQFTGLTDGAGNRMAEKIIAFSTAGPQQLKPTIATALSQLESLTLVKKPMGTDGALQTFGYGVTREPGGAHALVIMDLSIPTNPLLLSTIPMSDGGRVTVVLGVDGLDTQGIISCGSGGPRAFTGDLAILSSFDVGKGSAVRFYDVSNPSAPCPTGDVLGAKLLTVSPNLIGTIGDVTVTPDGAIPASYGFARGVAALTNGSALTSYVAVENVGLMMVDVGGHIPPLQTNLRQLEPYAEGNYIDVVAVNGRLLAIERTAARLDVFDGNLSMLASTAWTTGLSLRSAISLAYADGVPFDTNGDGQVDQDEILNLTFVGGEGGVAIVDVTDLSSPHQIGFVPLASTIYQVAFDPSRRRIFASGAAADAGAEFTLYVIDLTGESPFEEKDADLDGVDDRIVMSKALPNPITASNFRALRYDADTGTLFVGTDAGYELFRFANLTGTATFTYIPAKLRGLVYDEAREIPIRGAIVQLKDAQGEVLESTNTDEAGHYALNAPRGEKVEVVVLAALGLPGNETVKVVNNYNPGCTAPVGTIATACFTQYTQSSGLFTMSDRRQIDIVAKTLWTSAGYTLRDGGPFSILDMAYTAHKTIRAADAGATFSLINMAWSPRNRPNTDAPDVTDGKINTSHFDFPAKTLFLLGAENLDTDEYDPLVVLHEWSHYFQAYFSRDDSPGDQHPLRAILDPRAAFSEGFATSFAAMLTDFPIYIDTSGLLQVKASVDNIELDRSAWSSFFSEDAVEELLWDLYDGTSTEGDLEVDVGLIQDNVNLGFKPIYNAVTNGVRTTHAFTTIYSLFSALLPTVTPAVKADIVALANAEHIDIENANEFEQFTPNTIDDAFQVGVGTPGSATFDVDIGRLYTDVTVDWPAQATFGAGTPKAGEPLQTNPQYDPDLVGNRFGDFVYFKFVAAAPGTYRVQLNPVVPPAGQGPFSFRMWLNKRRSAEFCDDTTVDQCNRFQLAAPGVAVVIDSTFAAGPSTYTFAVAAYDANGKVAKANFTVQVTRQP